MSGVTISKVENNLFPVFDILQVDYSILFLYNKFIIGIY